ncbi:MAG: AmmeMemoRadiSam system protein B [Candidatus Omnitrophica bacterium]|nr:AmmeMemoRadiSam system protein B [Candidatus Omnitrophota bacterium]
MKNSIFFALLALLLSAIPASAVIKTSDLAGRWYTSSEEDLRKELDSYLDSVNLPKFSGKIIGLISPHAGLPYSGPVAAYGFKAISGQSIKTVIVVGFSHRQHYDGIAVLDEDGFKTPLGVVEIDREITQEFIKENPKIRDYPQAFSGENSIEMQIPFLQAVLGDFKIVLIAIGDQSMANCRITGESLYDVLKSRKDFILIASTDMSHYLSYDNAESTDSYTISLVKEFDADKFFRENLLKDRNLMCGYGAVFAVMRASAMLGADETKILKYANSGDTWGDKSRVVGYLSAAFIKSENRNPSRMKDASREILRDPANAGKSEISNPKQGDKNMLNEPQREKMLKLARNSIEHYLKTGKRLNVTESDPVLNREMGAFVTLHEKGELRGCIGNLIGQGPFYLTVRDMAVEAATGDPRFAPVRPEEMKDIDIEISALSPLEKIENPEMIEMGKHGVVVRNASRGGVYLPQVATETGWSREEFMNSLCGHKAGMVANAWKTGKCDIYIFTAEVFRERDK